VETPILVAMITGLPGLFAAFMVFRSSSRATNVNEKAQELGWVKELRQDAIDTRKEMEGLQDQVQTLRRQLATVSREAEFWITEYRTLHRTIWRDGVDIGRLRQFVGPLPPDPPLGGHTNGGRLDH
jgi:hypothetical protein